MERTPFAGLTVLDPGDALSLDGYSFQFANPTVIDNFLRLGAVGHRHDAHAAMVNPATEPTLSIVAVGGSIEADSTITVGYTLIDADGGESALSDAAVTATRAGLTDPVEAPELTTDTAAGTLLAGSYSYAATVTDGSGGETGLGPVGTIEIPPGSATNEVHISGLESIVADSGGTGWRLWRSVNSGEWNLVESGVTDTVTDDGTLCPNCNEEPPSEGSGVTNSTSILKVTVPAAGQPPEAVTFRIYASLDGTFESPALLGEYPVADYGVEKSYSSLDFLDGAPPAVSHAITGAHKLNPATEIDWAAIEAWPAILAAEAPVSINGDLEAGWQGFPNPGFGDDVVAVWLDATGSIRFSGRVQKSTAPANGDLICHLGSHFAAKYIPSQTRRLACASGDTANPRVFGSVDLDNDGQLLWRAGATGAGNWISLDGLTVPKV